MGVLLHVHHLALAQSFPSPTRATRAPLNRAPLEPASCPLLLPRLCSRRNSPLAVFRSVIYCLRELNMTHVRSDSLTGGRRQSRHVVLLPHRSPPHATAAGITTAAGPHGYATCSMLPQKELRRAPMPGRPISAPTCRRPIGATTTTRRYLPPF